MKIEYNEYQERLFEIISQNKPHEGFSELIAHLSNKGYSKEEIYELFLDFHKAIQLDERTGKSEAIYDKLSDFMDGFTSWGKDFKILPNEPDL